MEEFVMTHQLHHLLIQRNYRSDQIRSVAQSCPTLCDPMNRSTPGLPVQHQLLEFTKTHIHQVSDAVRGNEIDSLHPISDELITGLLLQGSLGEVLHAELVPSCSNTPATSSLPHMPAVSFPVLLGKWWPQWITEPSPSSRAQTAPSLASNAAWENATHVSGDPGYTELSAFLSFSMAGATNCLLGAAMVRHFCSGTIHSFPLEALSRCLS